MNFQLTVITPQRVVLDTEVTSLVAPGELGYLGILANHAPLITTLAPGRLAITLASGERQTFTIGPGFLDVLENHATLLTQTLQSDMPS